MKVLAPVCAVLKSPITRSVMIWDESPEGETASLRNALIWRSAFLDFFFPLIPRAHSLLYGLGATQVDVPFKCTSQGPYFGN